MPRSKCLSALASIKCQIAVFGLTNRRHHPRRQIGSWGLPARSGGKSLIYDSPRRRKGGSRLESALSGHWSDDQLMSVLGGRAKTDIAVQGDMSRQRVTLPPYLNPDQTAIKCCGTADLKG